MSQPPTLFPKSPLGSGQTSGTASTGSATPSTPAEQRPRLGTPSTAGTAPAVPPRPATPAPASPFKSAVPPLGTPAQPAGAAPAGSAFRSTTPASGLGSGLGSTPAAAARPPLGQSGLNQSGLGQTGLGQSGFGANRPPLGSTLPTRPASPTLAGGMAAQRPSTQPATSALRPPLTPAAAFRSPTQPADAARAASPFRKDLQIPTKQAFSAIRLSSKYSRKAFCPTFLTSAARRDAKSCASGLRAAPPAKNPIRWPLSCTRCSRAKFPAGT